MLANHESQFLTRVREWLKSSGVSGDHLRLFLSLAYDKKWIPLLGAGISISAGVPSASYLSTDLIQQLEKQSSLPQTMLGGIQERVLFEPAMQAISDHLGKKAVVETIKGLDTSRFTVGHLLIAEMISQEITNVILTTNFDSAMEETIKSRSGGVKSLNSVSAIPRKELSLGSSKAVYLKLHGEATRPELTVSTLQGYLRGYSSDSKRFLRASIEGGLLLIIGYAGWDLDFLTLIRTEPITPRAVLWIDLKSESEMRCAVSSEERRLRLAERRRVGLIDFFRAQGAIVYILKGDIDSIAAAILQRSTNISASSDITTGNKSYFGHLSRYPTAYIDVVLLDLIARFIPERIRQEALHKFVSSMSIRDACLRARVIIGEVSVRSGEREKALKVLTPVLEYDAKNIYAAIGAVWLGRIYVEKGQWDKAKKVFEDAVRLTPERSRRFIETFTRNDLGFWIGEASDIRNIALGAASVERIRELICTHVELRLFLEYLERIAAAYHFSLEPEQAMEIDKRYLEIAASAGDPSAYGRGVGNIGVCLLGLADLNDCRRESYLHEAFECLSESVSELDGIDHIAAARMQGNLGECHLQLGRREKGISLLRQCVRALHGRSLPLQVYFWASLSEAHLKRNSVRALAYAKKSVLGAVNSGEWGEGSRGVLALANSLREIGHSDAEKFVRQIAAILAEKYGNVDVLKNIDKI